MAKQKKKLFFTSMDVVIYAFCIFAIGIAVGLGFGRYKNSRFYFAEERLKAIEKVNDQFKGYNAEINMAIKNKIEPLILKMRGRLMESNKTDAAPANFNFSRAFNTTPDFLVGSTAIMLNLADGTNTRWTESITSTANKTGLRIEAIEPDADTGIYWVALPGINAD